MFLEKIWNWKIGRLGNKFNEVFGWIDYWKKNWWGLKCFLSKLERKLKGKPDLPLKDKNVHVNRFVTFVVFQFSLLLLLFFFFFFFFCYGVTVFSFYFYFILFFNFLKTLVRWIAFGWQPHPEKSDALTHMEWLSPQNKANSCLWKPFSTKFMSWY